MKSILTSLFLFVSFAGFAQLEFAPIGAEWYYSQYTSYNPPQTNYIKHTCIKDSMINGKNVKVIQKTKFTREGSADLGREYLYQQGDTIFYWKSGQFHELYNFSLSKGDSMLLYSEMPDYCPDKTPYGWIGIDSVYSVVINGYELKVYIASYRNGSGWNFGFSPVIEKIGSLQYLLPQSISCIMDVPGIGNLRCYYDPELGSFVFEKLPCETITAFPIFSSALRDIPLKIYPNPFANVLNIDFDSVSGQEFVVDICNSEGKRIYSKAVWRNTKIDTSSLRAGVYIISVASSGEKYFSGLIYKK